MPPIASRNRTATRYQSCITDRDPNITVMVNLTTKMKQSRFPSDSREAFHPPQSANDMPPDRGLPDIPEQISVPLFDSAESTEAELDKSALQHTPDVPNSHVSDRRKRHVTRPARFDDYVMF